MIKQDIFYRTNHLSVLEKKQLCKEAREKCLKWWVDKLDCSESFARQKIEMPFTNILKKLKRGSHFVFIIRNMNFVYDKDQFLEIGFRTMTGIDYFLWIHCDIKNLDYFQKKYKLIIM